MSLKYALLGLINYQPMTGYDLKNIFDSSVNYFWTASTSQIYRDLAELERNGFVTFHIEPQKGRPDKKIYAITETGKSAFTEWLNQFPLNPIVPIRSDFLVRVFFGSHIRPEELKFQFQKFIKVKREELVLMEQALRAHKNCPSGNAEKESIEHPDHFFWHLTAKMGYLSAKAELEWAQMCLEEYENYLKTQANSSQLYPDGL